MEQQQPNDSSSNVVDEQYCYQLTGAIVHVDPVLDEDEQDQIMEDGTMMAEGHYVTFICKPAENNPDEMTWIELDDEFVRVVGSSPNCCDDEQQKKCTETSSTDVALNILSGCVVSNNKQTRGKTTSSKRIVKEKERRYATLLVYSRES